MIKLTLNIFNHIEGLKIKKKAYRGDVKEYLDVFLYPDDSIKLLSIEILLREQSEILEKVFRQAVRYPVQFILMSAFNCRLLFCDIVQIYVLLTNHGT